MSYCPTCGRQRAGNAQYCGGCGRDFGVAPMPAGIEPEVAELAVAEPASTGPEVAEPASTVPAAESDAGLPRLEPAAGEPPTVTVMAGRPVVPASASPPPSLASLELETISEWAEPAGPPPRRPRRGRVPTLWILLAVIVPLAAGGGTFGLVKLASQHAAGPAAAPASTAVTTAPTQPASTQPVSPQASVSPSPSPSASPSPSVSPSVVSVGPGVASAPPGVEVVLSHYFQGINDRDYAEYASSQTAQGKADQPESSFDAGFATTTDTGMTLTSLTPTGGGDLTATVAFTSQQSPSDSVDNSACNDWTLNLYLVQDGAGYLITPAPPDYEPTYTDC
jgi:hypothetical protein